MTDTALVPEMTPEQDAAAEHSPGETHTPDRLFKLSQYLHVGEGAEECEHREDGRCDDANHFHAWCRLPNQFQHEEIREKAMAAKARRIRLLKDPETDAHEIMEFGIDELRETGDRQAMIDEIVAKDAFKTRINAAKALMEGELKPDEGEEDPEDNPYSNIEEDRERLRALEAKPEEERTEEYAVLKRHIAAFEEAVVEKHREMEQPYREGLEQRETEDLLGIIRQDRREKDASRSFMDVFSRWEWYLGTLKCRDLSKGFPSERYFSSIEQLEATADEVITALDQTFGELEAELASKGKGF